MQIFNSKYYNECKGRFTKKPTRNLKCQAAEPFFTALFTAVLIGHKPTLRPSASSGIPQRFCHRDPNRKQKFQKQK